MAIAIVAFVFVFVTILDIHGWIKVWQEAKVKVARQRILEQIILLPEKQKRARLFNAAIYPAQN
jgi:uncharacterized membrane protein YagU involved in acid resistance